jgi:multiple sugar transport system permease protein
MNKPVGVKSWRNRSAKVIIWLILFAGAIIFLFPFLWMISTSFKSMEEYYQPGLRLFVQEPHPENYFKALTTFPFGIYLKNTLVVTLTSMIFTCVFTSLTGYGFARIRVPGSNLWFMIMLSTMMLPGHVTMIPTFILFRNIGWINTLYPLIIPSAFTSVFNIFLTRQFFMRMPANLEESARIDGCSAFIIWLYIYLPLSKPVMATVAIFSFMGHWNDFMNPLIYINSDNLKTLTLGLRSFVGLYVTETNLLMAASIVVILPCILLFFFFQRYFIQGITFSGGK